MITIKIILPEDIDISANREIIVRLDGSTEVKLHLEDQGMAQAQAEQPAMFLTQMEAIIETLRAECHWRTAETYVAAKRRFSQFIGKTDIRIDEMNETLLRRFEHYLIDSGVQNNTVSFYMRILRAAYHKSCVAANVPANSQIFKSVYTGMDKTEKRAISIEELNKLKKFKTRSPSMLFARDIFMFSFYTRGMSFVDIANLKKTDVSEGKLKYRRSKTGQLLHIKWEPFMQEIVDTYDNPQSPYLLPIITQEGNALRQYRNKQNSINVHLKNIGRLIGLSKPLTLYVARHSWATIAKQLNVPLSVISDAMGHNNMKTTMIYLDSINSEVIDNANAFIISKLK